MQPIPRADFAHDATRFRIDPRVQENVVLERLMAPLDARAPSRLRPYLGPRGDGTRKSAPGKTMSAVRPRTSELCWLSQFLRPPAACERTPHRASCRRKSSSKLADVY